jgi:CheY-like chemotaxis protein
MGTGKSPIEGRDRERVGRPETGVAGTVPSTSSPSTDSSRQGIRPLAGFGSAHRDIGLHPPYHPPGRPQVLVVDNDFWVVDLLVDFISDIMGYGAFGVYGAEKAVARIRRSGDIDLVVSDIHMFGMGGVDLTRAVRRETDAKVILMGGVRGRSLKEEAVAAGAHGFLPKPIDLARLRDMIENLLEPAWTGAPSPHP